MKKIFRLKNLVIFPLLMLALSSCEKDVDNSPVTEVEFDHTNFTKLKAGERFNLIVTNDNDFHILAKGPMNSVNEMEVFVSDGVLHIDYAIHRNNRPKVDVLISLPTLSSVNLSGAATGTVEGFGDSPIVMRANLSGASYLKLTGTGETTNVEISGASTLEVSGATENLYGNISGAGKLKAYDLLATGADLSLTGGSSAFVRVVDALYVIASGGSKLYYKGNPSTKHFELSGGAEVVAD